MNCASELWSVAICCINLLLLQGRPTSSFHFHTPLLSNPFHPRHHPHNVQRISTTNSKSWNKTHPPFACIRQQSFRAKSQTALLSKTSSEDDAFLSITQSTYASNLPYEILPLDKVLKYLAPTDHGISSSNDQGQSLQNHLQTGLSIQQAHARLAQIGPNSLQPPKKTTIWELWLQQFDDTLVKILVGVAFASAAFSVSEVWDVIVENIVQNDANNGIIGGGIGLSNVVDVISTNPDLKSTILQSVVEPSIIIAILLLNAMVGVWQDLSARSSLEALEKMQPRLATVLRCDADSDAASTAEWITAYDATQLVPGDIIRLRVGDSIPADARLVSLASSTMYVDESSLTGESVSAGKLPGDEGLDDAQMNFIEDIESTGANSVPIQDQSSMLFSGCLVTRGSGIALIVRTGPSTQMGKIQSTLVEAQSEGEERKTPLGEQLDEFGTTLSYVIGGICLAVWVASIPHFTDSAFDTWIEGAVYYGE